MNGDDQKLARLAQKFDGYITTASVFGFKSIPGTYIILKAPSVKDDVELAAIANELKDVKQPVLLDLQNYKQLTPKGLSSLVDVKCVSGLYFEMKGLKSLIPAIAKITQLQYLVLNDESLADADLAPIASLVNLRGLTVIGNPDEITVGAYQFLANMTELELLSGQLASPLGVVFTDADLVHVSKLAKLKKFNVRSGSSGKLSDQGLANLNGMTGLEELQIDLTPDVTEKTLAVIGSLKNLRSLELIDRSFKPSPRIGLDKLLPLAPHLKVLVYNSFGNEYPASPSGGKTWLENISQFSALEKLELQNAGITDENLSLLTKRTRSRAEIGLVFAGRFCAS